MFCCTLRGVYCGASTCRACIRTRAKYSTKKILVNYLCIGFLPGGMGPKMIAHKHFIIFGERPRSHPIRTHPPKRTRVEFLQFSALLPMKQLFCCQLSLPKNMCIFPLSALRSPKVLDLDGGFSWELIVQLHAHLLYKRTVSAYLCHHLVPHSRSNDQIGATNFQKRSKLCLRTIVGHSLGHCVVIPSSS